jgi:flagellar motor switch protein FliN/FliY
MAAADKEKQKQDVKASEVEAEDDNQPAERELKDPGRLKRSAEAGTKSSANMDFLLDIPLEISVELGRTKMLINELLKLGQGSEVVVVNEKYGVRLTEIISPSARIERLK